MSVNDITFGDNQIDWLQSNFTQFLNDCKNWQLTNICAAGIPDSMRKVLWMKHLDRNLNLTEKIYNIYLEQGMKYLALDSSGPNTAQSQTFLIDIYQNSSIRTIFDIEQDITRTKAAHPDDFPQNFDISIRNILLAFTLLRPDIGYIQGMIPALLFIRKIYNEYETWKFFSSLILNDDIFPLFDYNMESMDRMSMTFDQILEFQNKKLFDWFKSIGLDNRVYLLKWFLSVFTEAFSFRQWKRIMDYLVFGGKSKFFRIA